MDLLRGRRQVRENNLKTVAALLDSEKENNRILKLQLDKLQGENNSLAVQLKLSQSQNRWVSQDGDVWNERDGPVDTGI